MLIFFRRSVSVCILLLSWNKENKGDGTDVSIPQENREDSSLRRVNQLFILFTNAFLWEDHQGEKLQSKLQWKDTFHPAYSFILGHMEKDVT